VHARPTRRLGSRQNREATETRRVTAPVVAALPVTSPDNGGEIETKQNETLDEKNTMTQITKLAVLLAGLTTVAMQAQERLSPEEALRYADLVGSVQTQLRNVPGATALDLSQPVAVRDGDYGLMVVPAAKLSADTLAKAGSEVVPVGQLWLLKLAPLVDERVVGDEKLQLVKVRGSEGSATVPCCHLGIRHAAGGALELLVFGKDKEPILKTALRATQGRQSRPLDLEVERESDRGRVTLKLAGQYAASFSVTDPELF